MAAPAGQLFASVPNWRAAPRSWRIVLTFLASILLAVAAAHAPAFMPSGADLEDATQQAYARNLWPQAQTSLAVLALFVPWLVYALMRRGSRLGRRLLLVAAGLGVALGLWLVAASLTTYAARPLLVSGVVVSFEGRTLVLDRSGRRSFYLVVSDGELKDAASWVQPGTWITMWTTPRGHAAYIGRFATGRPIPSR